MRVSRSDKLKLVVATGEVTLSGTVDWQYRKDAAKRCVKYLTGVTNVVNSITVKLTGSVSSWYERDQVVSGAWSAPGATWVKDELTIQS